MQQIKAIGYPFHQTTYGVFNPVQNIVDNAKNKIVHLLYTRKGQRIISQNCQFGMDLERMLFENLGYSDYPSKVANQIEKSIRLWIKQVDKLKVTVTVIQHKLEIHIDFSVGQQSDTIFLELKLNEIT